MLPLRKKTIKKLKWGIAGLGRFSENSILPAFQNVRRAKVISLYSSTPTRSKFISEKYSIQGAYSDYDAFLQSGIDAVYIGSANNNHYEQVIKAAEAKKHILCDKPLALTAKQAKEMVAKCKENNVLLAVDYIYRFHPLTQKAKELLANQTIGKLISIEAHFNINYPPNDNFRFNKALSGGGAIRDLGTHMIDMFRYLGGELRPLSCILDNIIYKSDVDDYASGTLKFETGGYATFSVSTNAGKAFNRIEILGHKGSISLDNLVGNKLSSAKMTILLDGEAKKAFRKRANKLHRLIKSVNQSFIMNETPAITGEDGLANMYLLEELERLAASK